MHEAFDPECFCHGRALWRFPGSDGARFSPRLAYSMVADAVLSAEGPMGLWDPFCGTAVIPAVARLFFAEQFGAIVASDISADAIACATQNLGLAADVRALSRRRAVVQGFRKRNPKSERRWGQIDEYLAALEPLVEQSGAVSVDVTCVQGEPPEIVLSEGRTWMVVADTPYGQSSAIGGEQGIEEILFDLASTKSYVGLDLVMPLRLAEALAPQIENTSIRMVKGGRGRLRRSPLSRVP